MRQRTFSLVIGLTVTLAWTATISAQCFNGGYYHQPACGSFAHQSCHAGSYQHYSPQHYSPQWCGTQPVYGNHCGIGNYGVGHFQHGCNTCQPCRVVQPHCNTYSNYAYQMQPGCNPCGGNVVYQNNVLPNYGYNVIPSQGMPQSPQVHNLRVYSGQGSGAYTGAIPGWNQCSQACDTFCPGKQACHDWCHCYWRTNEPDCGPHPCPIGVDESGRITNPPNSQ